MATTRPDPLRANVSPAPVWPGLLLVGAVLAVWAGSLTGAFVFDDIPAIIENPTLRAPLHLGAVLAPPGDEAGTVGGRPLVNLSLALNHAVGGTNPVGYHVVNLAIHATATLLLFGIVRRTLRLQLAPSPSSTPVGETSWTARDANLVALVVALLWALHPLQTEAVTYVVQRAESLMGLLYLLTLYGFVRMTAAERPGESTASGKRGWACLTFAACLLGMAAKEVMVTAPVVVLLYDVAFVTGSLRAAWQRRRILYVGLAATWLLLAVLVAGTHGRGGSAGFGSSADVWPYLLTQCRAIVRYLQLAFWPDPLVFDYGTALVRGPGAVAGQIALLLLLVIAAIFLWRRRPRIGFAAVAFFLVLAPSSSVVPIATEPMAEHRMYLPLAALVVLVAGAVFAGLKRFAPRRAALIFGMAGLASAVALGAATVRRNRDYRSEVALWTDTVQKVPGNPRAHNNLAEALRATGEPDRAATEFAAAVESDPGYAPAQYNLGVILLDSGHPQEAIPHLEAALTAPRHQAELRLFLGEACERTGQLATAAAHYRASLQLAPANAEAAFGLGNALAAQGDYRGAVDAYRTAVAAAPTEVRMRNNLGNALWATGNLTDAIAEYRAALKLAPDNAQIRTNLERALQQQKP